MKHLLFTLILAGSMLSVANAQVVMNVNFTSGNGGNPNVTLNGTASNPNVAPDPYTGSVWNDLPTAGGLLGPNPLLDSNGNATGASFTISDTGGNTFPTFGFSGSVGPSAAADIVDNYLVANDGFGPPVNPMTLTFSGLNPLFFYSLTFVSQGDSAGQGGSFTIGGNTLVTTGLTPTGAFVSGTNFVTFLDIAPDGAGNIDIIFDDNGDNTSFAVLNGVQVTVPEPTSGALLLGTGAFFLLRRRRNHS